MLCDDSEGVAREQREQQRALARDMLRRGAGPCVQIAQRIAGREADPAGEGHSDVCIGVHCHPTYNLLVRSTPVSLESVVAQRQTSAGWCRARVHLILYAA